MSYRVVNYINSKDIYIMINHYSLIKSDYVTQKLIIHLMANVIKSFCYPFISMNNQVWNLSDRESNKQSYVTSYKRKRIIDIIYKSYSTKYRAINELKILISNNLTCVSNQTLKCVSLDKTNFFVESFFIQISNHFKVFFVTSPSKIRTFCYF